jgi:oligopeptide transport system substrate-binding protein
MPWMPLDKNAKPAVNYVGFNTKRPPFSNPLVRQAFAAAIDRQVIADMARGYYQENVRPATTLTPPEVLGRDLYNSVGMVFDPEKAKNLFIQAGFEDPSKFPETTFMINSYGDTAPGARLNMVNKMVEMWKNYLGVEINVEVIYYRAEYSKLLSEGHGELYWLGWVADFNDPDNFLRGIFYTGSEYNYGMYTSTEFDQLVDDALISISPEKRQRLYIEAETLLCQTDAALIPLYFFTYY